MARTVELTEMEIDALKPVVDYWLEGMKEAKEATIADDRTLNDFEQMLDAVSGLDETTELLRGILVKLGDSVVSG